MSYTVMPRVTRTADLNAEYAKQSSPEVAPIEEANLMTSESTTSDEHYPAIDLDCPAFVIPSSTPGHFHLYIEKAVPWDKYLVVLEAMADAGLVEHGYVAACEYLGYTTLRLPWVKKEARG